MSDPYRDWAVCHATRFGLHTEAAAAMVVEWADLFAAEGYSAGELEAASRWLATHDPPRYPGDHLPALTARLRAVREEARAASRRERQEAVDAALAACPDCAEGWATVPALREDAGPLTVACSCAAGRRQQDTWNALLQRQGKGLVLTLVAYEKLRPSWREEKARRLRLAVARAEIELNARAHGGRQPTLWDTLIRRLLDKARAARAAHAGGPTP